MTILVTGASGTVGRQVVEQLVKRDVAARVLVRDAAKANFPAGVSVVQGDLLDIDALRSAFLPDAGDVQRLTAILGRPLRSHRDFVAEIVAPA